MTNHSQNSEPSTGEQNARRSKRVNVEAFVKISGGDREYVLRTRDLSLDGLFLYTKVAHIYPFRVGSTLSLELYNYDSFVSCEVVVVRVVEQGSSEAESYPTGFGLRFINMSTEDRQILAEMLEAAGENAGRLY